MANVSVLAENPSFSSSCAVNLCLSTRTVPSVPANVEKCIKRGRGNRLQREEIMRNKFLVGSVAVFILTSLSVNASAQSNIKAALLDMSAIMGMGTVGMMRPGTMGGTT